MKILGFIILCFVICSGTVHATSYAGPKKETVKSSNGKFLLTVDPKTREHSIYAAKNPEKKLWSFEKLVRMGDEHFVSDDGERVCIVSWQWIQNWELESDAISIWTRKGKEFQISYKKAGRRRRKKWGKTGPIGLFWRVWREGVSLDNNIVKIEIPGWGKRQVAIDLATGKLVSKTG